MTDIKSYRDLQIWQKSMDIVEEIYTVTASFPKEELYGLTSQLRRAAVSLPSNIAEGSAKKSTKEFMRFLMIAHGSLAEIGTQVTIAKRLHFLDKNSEENLNHSLDEIGKMLTGLYMALQNRLKSTSLNSKPLDSKL